MSTFLTSKVIPSYVPPDAEEMIVAIATGWTLEYIRELDSRDFDKASAACKIYLRAQKSWSEKI